MIQKRSRKNGNSKFSTRFVKTFWLLLSLCLLLAISFTSPLSVERVVAQSNIKIEGYVYDQESGHPLSGSEVRIANSSYQTAANSAGFFSFEKLPTGSYSLELYCPGYEKEIVPEVLVTEDFTRRVNIYLKRKIYELAPIEVTAARIPISSEAIEVIDKEKIRDLRASTVAEVLETLEGIFVYKTGTTAGTQEISIRGSSPEHVLVLIDGQRINPSSSGRADLNSIPLEMVERIEVHKGGASSRYGSDALAGAVNVITQPQTISTSTTIQAKNYLGTWGSDIFSLSLKRPLHVTNLATNLAYTYQTGDGDFQYEDPKQGPSRRENAYRRGYNLFFSGLYQFNTETHLAFSGQFYRCKNGIPGALYQLTRSAHLEDSRKLVNLKFKKDLSRKVSWEAGFGFIRFLQHFKSTTDQVRYDTEYIDDILSFSLSSRYCLFPKNKLELGTELERDILDHKDYLRPNQSMGKMRRQTFSLFLTEGQSLRLPGYVFFSDLNLNFSVRYDRPTDLQDFTSPRIGVTLSRGSESKMVLRSAYGKSYRQPSNNALFWKQGVWSAGNPDLLPEKSENYEAGGEIRLPLFARSHLSLGITYFNSFIWDVIVWRRRFDGRYMPVNISKAKITGHEDFIRLSFFDDKIEINYQNTLAKALNKSGDRIYDGKFIPFRPRYVTHLEYKLSYWLLLFSHRLTWVSERFTLEANTKKEKPYHLEDLRLGLKKRISRWEVNLDLQVRNLTDEKYMLIQNHPMPGREWGVNLEVIYGMETP